VGDYHSCGLKSDGSAVCWGRNEYGQTNVTGGTFVQLSAAGRSHTCGLKSDGRATCWGSGKTNTGNYPEYGQSIVPSGTFTQISVGGESTCGLKSDGSATCWGRNGDGQTNVTGGAFVQLSVGTYHSCGLKNDGSAICWGRSGDGQTTVPVDNSTNSPSPVSSNGFLITSDIWINARINTEEKGLINAVWRAGGDSTTGRGDRVIWGYFYASPTDVSWGNEDNPDMFVKVWFDASGRIDVNFFHVSVPSIEVYSSKKSGGVLLSIATTDKRYVLHAYNSNNTQTASVIDTRNASVLKISFPTVYGIDDSPPSEIIIQTEEKGGIVAGGGFADVGDSGTTARGDIVGWGYYYAKPSDVSWGSRDNPEVFYKFWLDVSGRMDMNFFHVSVPEIVVSSLASDTKGNRSPTYRSTVTLSNRYARHEYSPK